LDQLSKCSHAKANSYPMLSRRWKKKEDWKNGWNLMDHLMSGKLVGPQPSGQFTKSQPQL